MNFHRMEKCLNKPKCHSIARSLWLLMHRFLALNFQMKKTDEIYEGNLSLFLDLGLWFF